MANEYIKHDWVPEEIIFDVGLNHMEEGIENAYKKIDTNIQEVRDNVNTEFDNAYNKIAAAYNRAERQVDDIIENSEEVKQLLIDKITNFLVTVDKEGQKISFKVLDQEQENTEEPNNNEQDNQNNSDEPNDSENSETNP